MRMMIAAALVAAFAFGLSAQDKGTPVEWAGLKSTAPAAWKKETPMDKLGLRVAQFKLDKAEGDKEQPEIVVFYTKGGGGVDANVKRQLNNFEPPKGSDKVDVKEEKTKVGKYDGKYVDIKGTFIRKPFPMAKEGTPVPDFRQIYVVFEDNDGAVASVWLRGPAKSVEKHKKEFDEWVKNFK
jgi:hypothetical protein